MRLTWRQFQCYQEAFSWLLNEQSDKGKQENARNDLMFLANDPRVKENKKREVEEAKERMAKMKARMHGGALH